MKISDLPKNSVHKLSYDEANDIKNILLVAYEYIKETHYE